MSRTKKQVPCQAAIAYAASLRVKAAVLQTHGVLMSNQTRDSVAADLEALATLAENHPDVFARLPLIKRMG